MVMTDLEKMAGHTPGPWKVGYSDGSGAGEPDGCYTICNAADATVVWSGDSFGLKYGIRNEADAFAIAAVPELINEVKQLRAALERLGSMGAFTNSFRLPDDTPAAEELRARIDFARASLNPTE